MDGKMLTHWIARGVSRRGRQYVARLNPRSELSMRRRYVTKHAQRVRRLHGTRSGTCVIIGNGPSLLATDLTRIPDYFGVFGLNKIHLLPSSQRPRLSFHVAVNRLVIEQARKDFSRLECPSFLPLHALATSPQPHEIPIWTRRVKDFQIACDWGVAEGSTVTFAALQLALYLGFRTVILVGVDHRFEFSGAPHEEKTLEGPDPNHFSPDYFGGMRWNNPDLEASERSYEQAREAFALSGGRIVDCTVGGALEVFEKSDLQEEISRVKSRS